MLNYSDELMNLGLQINQQANATLTRFVRCASTNFGQSREVIWDFPGTTAENRTQKKGKFGRVKEQK